jgi:small subunit ribosomal protein S2
MRKISKLQYRLGGIRTMRDLPRMVVVVDIRRESTAVREANILDIPVIAMVDTNCDPSLVEHVLPANDDAIRAIRLIIGHLADAVIEGRQLRKDEEPEGEQGAESVIAEMVMEADEDLLGAATLAKLSSGELEFEDKTTDTETTEVETVDAKTSTSVETDPQSRDAEDGAEKGEPDSPESEGAVASETNGDSNKKIED